MVIEGLQIRKEIKEIIDKIYPVGSIYFSVNNTNPSELFGGTWVIWGSGRVPVGVDADLWQFESVEMTGGETSHRLTQWEMAQHKHDVKITTQSNGGHSHLLHFKSMTASDYNLSGNGDAVPTTNPDDSVYGNSRAAFENTRDGTHTHIVSGVTEYNIDDLNKQLDVSLLQPYITCYMFKRTA